MKSYNMGQVPSYLFASWTFFISISSWVDRWLNCSFKRSTQLNNLPQIYCVFYRLLLHYFGFAALFCVAVLIQKKPLKNPPRTRPELKKTNVFRSYGATYFLNTIQRLFEKICCVNQCACYPDSCWATEKSLETKENHMTSNGVNNKTASDNNNKFHTAELGKKISSVVWQNIVTYNFKPQLKK